MVLNTPFCLLQNYLAFLYNFKAVRLCVRLTFVCLEPLAHQSPCAPGRNQAQHQQDPLVLVETCEQACVPSDPLVAVF